MWQSPAGESRKKEPVRKRTAIPSGGVALPDLAERLGLSTERFRSYLNEYADLLRVSESSGERILDARAAEILTTIHRLTQRGLDPQDVRNKLEFQPDDQSDNREGENLGENSEGEVTNDFLLREIREGFHRLEERRLEDRDKLMLALIKTQKEIQQLRYQLAAGEGRSRRGFFARLFGR
ncbi:MAG: MerR family transcriptional regulator [Bacillota bacterium]